MDLRDLVKLAGIVNPELLNRIDATAEVEEADGAGFEQSTTAPDEEIMDDPLQSMGSDVDTSLRRYLKAKGDHVTVDEDVYPDITVDDLSEAYSAFKKHVNEKPLTPTDDEWSKLLKIPNRKSWEKMVKSSKEETGAPVEEDEMDRARYDADETPRGEKKKKVTLKKAPWEKDDDVKEADIDENAFNQAAAAAARAGKDTFEFGGKTHKTTMKKDVAHKLDDDVNDELAVLRRNAGI